MNVFIKIINNNMSPIEDLCLYCHPEIVNRCLESLEK